MSYSSIYFKELHFYTHKVIKQYEFYKSLNIDVELIDDSTLIIQTNKTKVFFHTTEKRYNYHYCWLVSESTLLSFLPSLKEKNIEIIKYKGEEIIHFENWNADSIYFRDGADNIVEIIVHNSIDSEGYNGTNQFLQMAEIGIVSNDLEKVKKTIYEITKLTPYKTDAPPFKDVGIPGSMFIAVDPDKKEYWFPTETPLSVAPVEGILSNKDIEQKFKVDEKGIEFG